MSKGTQMKGVRIPPALQQEIDETIARRNVRTDGEPWTFTGFILKAIREKLDHMARSRKCRMRPGRKATREEFERQLLEDLQR